MSSSSTHPANLDIVKTKIQRWSQDQIKSVDDDVENHILQIRKSNSTFGRASDVKRDQRLSDSFSLNTRFQL